MASRARASRLPVSFVLCGNLYFVASVQHIRWCKRFYQSHYGVFVQIYNFILLVSIHINPEMEEGGELGVRLKIKAARALSELLLIRLWCVQIPLSAPDFGQFLSNIRNRNL